MLNILTAEQHVTLLVKTNIDQITGKHSSEEASEQEYQTDPLGNTGCQLLVSPSRS